MWAKIARELCLVLLVCCTWLCDITGSGWPLSISICFMLLAGMLTSISLLFELKLLRESSSLLALALLKWSPSIEVNTSPPNSIRRIRTQSCWSDKSSIWIVDMLETVAVDTEVNIRSKITWNWLPMRVEILQSNKTSKWDCHEVNELNYKRIALENQTPERVRDELCQTSGQGSKLHGQKSKELLKFVLNDPCRLQIWWWEICGQI